MLKQFAVAAITLATIGNAMAASGDAWAEFAAEVEQACLGATEGVFAEATAVVDPFGSESYGLAIVSGTFPSGGTASIICVFDKATQAVQIGGELPIAVKPTEAQ